MAACVRHDWCAGINQDGGEPCDLFASMERGEMDSWFRCPADLRAGLDLYGFWGDEPANEARAGAERAPRDEARGATMGARTGPKRQGAPTAPANAKAEA